MAFAIRIFSIVLTFSFVSGGQVVAASVLNFPRVSFDPNTITGVAIANPGATDATVTLTLYGNSGTPLQAPGLVNPQQVSVPAGQQYAEVTSAIFGNSAPASTVAWLQAVSDAEDLTGFFLFLNPSITFFDGADLPRASRRIVFNEVRVDSGFSTELNLVNPSQTPVTVTLRLMGGASPVVRSIQLPIRGVQRLDAANLFGLSASGQSGPAGAAGLPRYVLAESDGPGVAGFAFARGPGDLLGQSATPAGEALTTLYFPQLAVLGPFETQLVVANTGNETAILTISARRADGSLFDGADLQTNPVARALPAGAVMREDLEELFGFSGDDAREGWLQVDSSTQTVSGSISYATPVNGSLAAVGSLAQGSRRAVFSHIATTAGFFTGVALLNTSSLAANYRITALRPDGSVLGSASSLLRPGERISRLIEQLVPEAAGQAGGLILVQSDVPLYLTSLFGSTATGVLANIPPQPVPASFDPAPGTTLQVTPPFAILAPANQQTFSLQGGAVAPVWSVDGTPGGSATSGFINAAGQFSAPALVPSALPVTISAQAGLDQAAASVDIISERELAGGLGFVRSVAFLEGLRRVYTAELQGAGAFQRTPSTSGQGVGSSDSAVYEVTSGTRQLIRSFPGADIVKMLGFTSDASVDYLLLLDQAGGTLSRLNPLTLDVTPLASGLNLPAAMTFDPFTDDLLVAEFNQVIRIPAATLVTAAAGALPEGDFETLAAPAGGNRLTGIAVDRCSGDVIVSEAPAPLLSRSSREAPSASLFRLDRSTGSARPLGFGVNNPGQLLPLYRRGLSCPDAFQLLTVDNDSGAIVLSIPSMDFQSVWIPEANAFDLAFIPAMTSSVGPQGDAGLGGEASVAIAGVDFGGQNPIGSAALADVPGLYEAAPVNPPPVVAPRSDFDAVLDFSASQNPAGPWGYGYSDDLGGAFIPFAGSAEQRLGNISTPGAFFWSLDIAGTVFDFPLLGGNLSGADISGGTALIVADRLLLHPGQNGQYAVLRWTAPEAGTYFVQGSFRGLDQTTTDVHVLIDNSVLVSRNVNGFSDTVGFSFQVGLPQGGIPIDMAVGIGGNAFNFDSTGVRLMIDRID